MQSKKEVNRSFAGIALVVEFLGILGATPLLGTLIDMFALGKSGPGLFALLGLGAGFVYGLIHLVRRAKVLAAELDAPGPPERLRNREGYESDLPGRINQIRSDLDEVGLRIKRATREGGDDP